MNKTLKEIKNKIYQPCFFQITNYKKEEEGQEYDACQFELNGLKLISRTAKITPKKVGQFVTFWKRNNEKITAPYDETDEFQFYIINVKKGNQLGQFVFPKSVLIQKGIVTNKTKDGKRGFRVYPSWDNATSKQAIKTQKWQLNYFYEVNDETNFSFVKERYSY